MYDCRGVQSWWGAALACTRRSLVKHVRQDLVNITDITSDSMVNNTLRGTGGEGNRKSRAVE